MKCSCGITFDDTSACGSVNGCADYNSTRTFLPSIYLFFSTAVFAAIELKPTVVLRFQDIAMSAVCSCRYQWRYYVRPTGTIAHIANQ